MRNNEKDISNLTTEQLSAIYPPKKCQLIARTPDRLTVGDRIRRERYLRKLTLEQMATYLNISPSYLGSMERGKRPLSRKMMDRLHSRLDLSYDFLVDGVSLSHSSISQYVKESAAYTTHHNLNVLLNVCTKEELEACYQLIHTYLTHAHNTDEEKPENKTTG